MRRKSSSPKKPLRALSTVTVGRSAVCRASHRRLRWHVRAPRAWHKAVASGDRETDGAVHCLRATCAMWPHRRLSGWRALKTRGVLECDPPPYAKCQMPTLVDRGPWSRGITPSFASEVGPFPFLDREPIPMLPAGALESSAQPTCDSGEKRDLPGVVRVNSWADISHPPRIVER